MKSKRFIGLLLVVFTLCSCGNQKQNVLSSNEDTSPKQIQPWFVCRDNVTFSDLEPYKDMLSCISVFGELPDGFIKQCHANHIEVYHAVGGNAALIDTPERRAEVVRQYVDICKKKNYDGIDLDFEHLPSEFQTPYSEFLRLASKELHANNKKLSHCVGYHPAMFDDSNAQIFCDAVVLNETCDLVRVMCYDMFFGPGVDNKTLASRPDCTGVGATSNFMWTKRAMKQWSSQIDKEKLVMALPAYGNDYSLGDNSISGRQIYACLPDSVKGDIPAPRWLYNEKLNLYIYDGLDGNKHLFYASDAKSTEALLQLADELGIKRIGFWHFSSVSKEMWDVTRAWMNK